MSPSVILVSVCMWKIEEMSELNNKKYHAFISYRHADNKEPGRQWATWLHQAIETYEVPGELVGKENGRGEIIPARIYPIFRDEEELPANADLGKSIVGALDSTRLLIVLCSPRAVESTYVADEIHYFKQQGHSDRIIAAMIDGEPNTSWDKGKLGVGFKVEDECFPLPLQFEYDEQGVRTDKHAEPIAADFRINNNGVPEQSWTSSEAYRLHLQEQSQTQNNHTKSEILSLISAFESQQHLMLLKIISGILGVPLGELTQRDKAYQLEQAQLKARKLRRWLFAITGLALLAIAAGFLAYSKQQEAEQQTRVAQVSESKIIAQSAVEAFSQGDYLNSIKLALSVLPYSFNKPERAFSPDAEAILSSAVFHEKLIYSGKGDKLWNDFDWLNKEPYKTRISRDQTRLILYGAAAPAVIDLVNGNRVELEAMPGGVIWKTKVSKDGNFIAAERESDDGNQTYVWSTLDGSLILNQQARFSLFSSDEKLAGFYIKKDQSQKEPFKKTVNKSKKKTIEGYLVDIATGNKVTNFVGELTFVDQTENRLLVHDRNNCHWRFRKSTQCDVVANILSIPSGELLLEIPGELQVPVLANNLVILKNSKKSIRTAKVSNISKQKNTDKRENVVKGVSVWDLKKRKQVDFYSGRFTYFDKEHQRLFVTDESTHKISLWDTENHTLLLEFSGKIVPYQWSWEEDKVEQLLLLDRWEEITFLVSSGTEENEETRRYSLIDGKLISQTKGQYLGLHNEDTILTYLRIEVESESQTIDRVQVFTEEYDIPLIEMDDHLCDVENEGFSNYPEMPRVEGNVVLFNCNNNIHLYYPNSANPQRPEIIPSKFPAKWVSKGGVFWFGEDYAEVMSFSHWEGGGVHSEKMMRVKLEESIEFTSLLNGKYLLAQTPDSGFSLWNSSGDIFEPVVVIEEYELAEDYVQQFEDGNQVERKEGLNKKEKLVTELGFDFNRLRKPKQKQAFDPEASYQESIDEIWTSSKVFSEHPLSKITTYKVEKVIELKKDNLAVIIGANHAYLLNCETGEKIAPLYEGIEREDYFFEGFHESSGVSENPNQTAFIFYNPFGAWLFDMQGQRKLTLCDDLSSCQYNVNFEWLGDKNSVFIIKQNPVIYSLDNDSQIDLCKSYEKNSECREVFRSFVRFGNDTIATGSAIFDFKSGIKILQLPGELGGMFAHPSRFNEDESAILMSAESGGGMDIYGIWKLPERGESLLQKARNKYLEQ